MKLSIFLPCILVLISNEYLFAQSSASGTLLDYHFTCGTSTPSDDCEVNGTLETFYTYTVPQDGELSITGMLTDTSIDCCGQANNLSILGRVRRVNEGSTIFNFPGTVNIECVQAGDQFEIYFQGDGRYSYTTSLTANSFATDIEPNDNISEANDLDTNILMDGHIDYGFYDNDRFDFYKIKIPYDGDFMIIANFEIFGYLNLRRHNGNSIGTVSGVNDTIIRHCVAQNDSFYLRLYADVNICQGYDLQFIPFNPSTNSNDTEPNDSSAEAIDLDSNTLTSGRLDYGEYNQDEEDFYKIKMPYDGDMMIIVNFETQGQLWFQRNNGSFIQQVSGMSDTIYQSCVAQHDSFYLRLFSNHNNCQGYDVQFIPIPPTILDSDAEPNDTQIEAGLISLGASQTGHIGYGFYDDDENDWFQFVSDDSSLTKVFIQSHNSTNFYIRDNSMNVMHEWSEFVGVDSFIFGGFVGDTFFIEVEKDVDCASYNIRVDAIVLPSAEDELLFDNLGREFYLMFNDNSSTPNSLTLSLLISSPTASLGKVEIPGLGFSADFAVAPGQFANVILPDAAEITSQNLIENKGIHVTATNEIAVYGLNERRFVTEGYLGIPVSVLGTEYIIMSYPSTSANFGRGLFGFVATEDSTTVMFTLSTDVDTFYAGIPYSIMLHAGQSYQLKTTTTNSDLTGSMIESDKPISVFGGHRCADIPINEEFCNHLIEQLPAVSAWGKTYFTSSLATRLSGDLFRVLGAEDDTRIYVNDMAVDTLDRGEFYETSLPSDSFNKINSDKAIYVAQFSKGTSTDGVTGDPFMMNVPPFENFSGNSIFTIPYFEFDEINYVNIITPSYGVGAIRLNGDTIPSDSFEMISGTPYAGVRLAIAQEAHVLESDGIPFGAIVYGYDDFDSYGYPSAQFLSPIAEVAHLTISPKHQSVDSFTAICYTAMVTDDSHSPVAGIRVDFIVSGVHEHYGFALTDENGEAEFCYTGSTIGLDTIIAPAVSIMDTAFATWGCEENINTWIGPSFGNWYDDVANWSLGEFPRICQHVVIPAGVSVLLRNGEKGWGFILTVEEGAILDVELGGELEIVTDP